MIRTEWISLILFVFALIIISMLAISDYKQCQLSGGVLVRGAFWFECVARP